MDLKERVFEGLEWIYLTQNRVHWNYSSTHSYIVRCKFMLFNSI